MLHIYVIFILLAYFLDLTLFDSSFILCTKMHLRKIRNCFNFSIKKISFHNSDKCSEKKKKNQPAWKAINFLDKNHG